GAVAEIGAAVREIDAEGVDRVEVVARVRLEDEALIGPAFARLGGIEGGIGHQADRARVLAEARQAIVEIESRAAPADRGRPDVLRAEAERALGPTGDALADRAGVRPAQAVRRGLDLDSAAIEALSAGAEGGVATVDLDDRGIVDAQVAGHRGLRFGGVQRR